jgi:hypothetical protein
VISPPVAASGGVALYYWYSQTTWITEWFVACVHGGVTERRRGACVACSIQEYNTNLSIDRKWQATPKEGSLTKANKEKGDGKTSFLGSIHMAKMSNSKSKKDKKKHKKKKKKNESTTGVEPATFGSVDHCHIH